MAIDYPQLPLSELKQSFCRALAAGSLLLEAEPGAGKSTLAPLWALEAIAAGEVWLIQPRVLAATSIAARLAALRGEAVGQTVGYQIPFERRRSRQTRLLLMTPGVLLQRLLADPELQGVRCVMLDEVHERSVDQDTAWAWLQEAAILNESLSLVLMSATPDAALKRQVDTALFSPGRCFAVALDYCPARQQGHRNEPIAAHVLRALESRAHWQAETVLVFLPGWRAIEECRKALQRAQPAVAVHCLHSRVDRAEQMGALDPGCGPRVILATNIAETSLTIADVTLVVDSGLVREPVFEQRTGVTRLTTRRISQASAEQRRGRAGRVQAGHCIRLWPQGESLAPQTLPEIRRSDYLPLALRLAHWGTPAADLPWLESPNPLALEHARDHLRRWQFIHADGAITELGRTVARLGTHPRIAAILLHSGADLQTHPWLLLLALALHFDLPVADDLEKWLASAAAEYRRNRKWQRLAQRWQKALGVAASPVARVEPLPESLADRLASVLSDRLGRRTSSGRYRLNSGISVRLTGTADWALVVHVSWRGREHRGIGMTVAPTAARIRELAEPRRSVEMASSGKRRRWVEHTGFYLGGQQVDEQQRDLAASEVPEAIVALVRQRGLAQLNWPDAALTLLLRARWAAQLELLDLPALGDAQLQTHLGDWLAGFLHADSGIDQLPLQQGLAFYLGFGNCQALDKQVPETLCLPSGRPVAVDYQGTADKTSLVAGAELPMPTVSAKLQEFFGAEHLQAGKIPLSIQLLSPAGRPLAITRDLAYFWREVYPQVRREMRGRYVKHPWPEDPLAHQATAKTNRRLRPVGGD